MIKLELPQRRFVVQPSSQIHSAVVVVAWTASGLIEAVRVTRHGKEGRTVFVLARPHGESARTGIAKVSGCGFNIGTAGLAMAANDAGFSGVPEAGSLDRIACDIAEAMGYSTITAVTL